MKYRISSITYHDGVEKQDIASVHRLGRLVGVDPLNIIVGHRLFMINTMDFMKSILTSPIRDYDIDDKSGVLTIKTENSIYYLDPEIQDSDL